MKNMLTQVRKDMAVYDREGNMIGTVETVYFGDEDLERPGVETATAPTPDVANRGLIENVPEALNPDNRIPTELRSRLQRYGFIKVETGILASDRYARADQITKVDENRVELNVTQDELITT
jgi:hypothetical protein